MMQGCGGGGGTDDKITGRWFLITEPAVTSNTCAGDSKELVSLIENLHPFTLQRRDQGVQIFFADGSQDVVTPVGDNGFVLNDSGYVPSEGVLLQINLSFHDSTGSEALADWTLYVQGLFGSNINCEGKLSTAVYKE